MVKKRGRSKLPRGLQVWEEKLLKDPRACGAFEGLTARRGVDKEKLLSLLFRIPFASKKLLGLIDGMDDRRVRALPDQIRDWADVIERVNASPWVGTDFLSKHGADERNPSLYPKPLNSILTPERAEPSAKLFRSVPGTLRFYADQLQARLEFFHPTGRRRVDLGYRRKQIDLRKWLTLELLKLVRDSAGTPRYKEIVSLLSRAYEVAGKPQIISEEDLSKLKENNPWITWVLHEAGVKRKTGQGTL